MKNTKLLAIICAIPLLLSSCASVLNGKKQSVYVNTQKNNAKVYLNNDYIGKGSVVEVKMPRNRQEQQIKIEAEGFKDQYLTHYQDRKSALYILSWVPFGILFYPPFLDYGPKSFNYNKELSVKQKYQTISTRFDEEKFVYVQNIAFDVNEDNFIIKRTKNRNYKKGKEKYKNLDTNDKKIEFDNSIFSDEINDILLRYNYADTTNTVFKKKTNTMYINANVKNIELNEIYETSAKAYMSYLISEVKIDWELTDYYGQPKFSKEYAGKSGEFVINFKNLENSVRICLADAVNSSFLKFIEQNEVREFLDKSSEKAIEFNEISISKGTNPSSISEAMKAAFTIKTDKGHGSGFVISKDGYLVTNLHVVANSKEIVAIDNDGNEYEATVIRQNGEKDLALLKIEKSFSITFDIFNSSNVQVGNEIFAIGTPNSVELGQTLSKGIVSGLRKNDNEEYIQTDASVNSGNSGGPLISKDGSLIGVVNAKLKGFGVEGIGFAIPLSVIKEALFLK